MAVGVLAGLGCSPREQPSDPALTLETEVQTILDRYRIAAVGVGVIRDGRLVTVATYGEQAPGIPATPQTLFNVASMAKPIAAEILVRAASEGRLDLDEPMAPHWVDPDLADDPRHRLLTPRLAISHQTGFLNWRRMNDGGKLAFVVDPGSQFGYSGEGYNYVGRFLERRLATDYEALAERYVFGPLGMTSSSLSERPWMTGRVALPMDSLGQWSKPDLRAPGVWSAADNLFTTVEDYAKLLIGVMNGDGLTPAMRTERLRIHSDVAAEWPCVATPRDRCPDEIGFALGWFRFDYGDQSVIWHGGDDWGEHSLAYYYPSTRDGYIVLVNGGNGRYAELDVLQAIDTMPPMPGFVGVGPPLAIWMRTLLDAAYAGTLSERTH